MVPTATCCYCPVIRASYTIIMHQNYAIKYITAVGVYSRAVKTTNLRFPWVFLSFKRGYCCYMLLLLLLLRDIAVAVVGFVCMCMCVCAFARFWGPPFHNHIPLTCFLTSLSSKTLFPLTCLPTSLPQPIFSPTFLPTCLCAYRCLQHTCMRGVHHCSERY